MLINVLSIFRVISLAKRLPLLLNMLAKIVKLPMGERLFDWVVPSEDIIFRLLFKANNPALTTFKSFFVNVVIMSWLSARIWALAALVNVLSIFKVTLLAEMLC